MYLDFPNKINESKTIQDIFPEKQLTNLIYNRLNKDIKSKSSIETNELNKIMLLIKNENIFNPILSFKRKLSQN